jgi:hypothetical protein
MSVGIECRPLQDKCGAGSWGSSNRHGGYGVVAVRRPEERRQLITCAGVADACTLVY